MNDSHDQAETVDGVIAQFLMEVESGNPGDVESLVGKYPEHADRIRAYFARSASLEEAFGLSHPEPRLNIPDYEIQTPIGRGGMGIVYRARQVSLNRPVAIKVARDGVFTTRDQRSRFLREAQAAARLQHPNIVPVYEVGEHDGVPYMVQALAIGNALSAGIKDGPLDPRTAASLMAQVALAIEYSHQSGIVHRDIKPANIILSVEDKPLVTDFGLARIDEDSGDQLTKTGDVVGTPAYVPPEALQGKRGDERGDIYSLGATLYEMLTGRPPFQGANLAETIQLVSQSNPVALRAMVPTIPQDLESICLKCMRTKPENRYESCRALADDLQRFLAGQPTLARPIGWLERARRWSVRNPRIATLSAVSTLALVALAITSGAFAMTVSGKNTELENSIKQRDDALVEANESLGLVRAAAYDSFTRLVESDLKDVPGAHQLRRGLLEDAVQFHRKLAETGRNASPLDLAIANRELAEMEFRLGNVTQAVDAITEADSIAKKATSPEAKLELARARIFFGQLLREQSDSDASVEQYSSAINLLETLPDSHQRNTELARGLYGLAVTCRYQERPDLWISNVERAVSVARDNHDEVPTRDSALLLCTALLSKGVYEIMHSGKGEKEVAGSCPRAERAAASWGEAFEICDTILKLREYSQDNGLLTMRAKAMGNQGNAMAHIEKSRKQGIVLQRSALAFVHQQYLDNPHVPKYADDYVEGISLVAISVRGIRSVQEQDEAGARREYEAMIRFCKELKDRDRHWEAYLHGLLTGSQKLAAIDRAEGKYQAGADRLQAVVAEIDSSERPVPPQLQSETRELLNGLSKCYRSLGDHEKNLELLDRLVPLYREASRETTIKAEVAGYVYNVVYKARAELATKRYDALRKTLADWERDKAEIFKEGRSDIHARFWSNGTSELAEIREQLEAIESAGQDETH